MTTHKLLPFEAAKRPRKTRIVRTMFGLRTTGIIAATTIAAAGCNNALDVKNPGAIQEGQLGDPALARRAHPRPRDTHTLQKGATWADAQRQAMRQPR